MKDPNPEICVVCKVEPITGAIFAVRLRTEKDRERVSDGVNTCDRCSDLVMSFLRSPELHQVLKELLQ